MGKKYYNHNQGEIIDSMLADIRLGKTDSEFQGLQSPTEKMIKVH